MVARIFAEMGMKRLFRIILKLIIRTKMRTPRVVRLRGSVVKVDPRAGTPKWTCRD
jgi:hypothetical protein